MTSVLYLMTSRQPDITGTDAVFQEVAQLAARFGGETINLHPSPRIPRYPRALFGFQKLNRLRRAQKHCDVTHVYSAAPYYFPVLRWLRKPIVYTIAAGVGPEPDPRHVALLQGHAHVVVSNERDARLLRSRGLTPAAIIAPGTDTSKIQRDVLPLVGTLTLLMASAPWVADQFETKGVDMLLDAVVRLPYLKLILLWRGLHYEGLLRRVRSRGIGDRVEILNEHVSISDYLKRSHAAILLAKRSDIVKAYPHSLLESLAAGKPVLLSAVIPMSDFVRDTECGVVVHGMVHEQLIQAIQTLVAHYSEFSHNALRLPPQTFSLENMLNEHRKLYEHCVLRSPR